jgi:hypothetical protein
MVYNTQNYWVFGLCPSSGIPEKRKQRFGNWICFRPQVKGETFTLLGLLERTNQLLRLALFKGPKRVGVFPNLPKDEKRSSFQNVVFSIFWNTGPWTKSKKIQ